MKILKNILFWASTACLVVAILLIVIPKLFGVEFRAVVTGSMSPEIPVGSLVVIVPTPAEDIQIGDDIAFTTQGGKVVTHRVVGIDLEKNEFITWGIANAPDAKDAPNRYENIIGVVKFHMPVIGQIFAWLSTTSGKIIAATIIIVVYIVSCLLGMWAKKPDSELETPAKTAPPEITSAVNSPVIEELMKSFQESEKMFREVSWNDTLGSTGDAPPPEMAQQVLLSQEGASELHSTEVVRPSVSTEPLPVVPPTNLFEDFLKSDKPSMGMFENQ